MKREELPTSPSIDRHKRSCKVCSHPHRAEIEQEFIAWKSPAKIAREFRIPDRASIYRHAHVLNLFAKRARNVRAALEKIIEQAGDVPVNASAVVQAIAMYTRLGAQDHLLERGEQVNLEILFGRMSPQELEVYAKEGIIPAWFGQAMSATQSSNSGATGDT